jgi:hypothetical protein
MTGTRESARPNFAGIGRRRSGRGGVGGCRNYRFPDCRAGVPHDLHPPLNRYMSGLWTRAYPAVLGPISTGQWEFRYTIVSQLLSAYP